MLKLTVVCFALVAVCSTASLPADLTPSIRLTSVELIQNGKNSSRTTRALDGVDVCLNTDIRDVTFEGCARAPCELTVGRLYHVKVDFVARQSHRSLKATISFDNYFNLEPALDVEIPGSAVEAGRMYTVSFALQPRGQVTGESILRAIVYDDESPAEYQWEVCFNVFLNIH